MKKSLTNIEPLEARIAPATFTVTTLADSGPGSLRDAIEQANAALGADEIVFTKTGTIKLKNDLTAITDDLAITGPVPGKASKLKISGEGMHEILSIQGASVLLKDLTITKGFAERGGGILIDASGETVMLDNVAVVKNKATDANPGATTRGGGIAINAGTVTIENSNISGNVAKGIGQIGMSSAGDAYGGGIWSAGALTITESVISGNKAKGGASETGPLQGGNAYGGGIYASGPSGSLTVVESTISKNKALGGKGGEGDPGQAGGGGGLGSGGGVYNWRSTVAIIGTNLTKNLAKGAKGGIAGTGNTIGGFGGYGTGGAIANSGIDATLTLENSILSGNKALAGKAAPGGTQQIGYGGAIYSGQSIEIETSTISGNKATRGGGVYTRGSLTIEYSTISGNRAAFGGGFYQYGGSVSLIQVTVANNVAKDLGGGLYKDIGTLSIHNSTFSGNSARSGGGIANSSSSSPTIVSTIIAGNSATSDPDVVGSIDATNSLIGRVTSGMSFGTDANNLKNEDAKLGPLQDNGGPTFTMLPKASSPVIDAGSNPLLLNEDQRGVIRVKGSGPDIGAVER